MARRPQSDRWLRRSGFALGLAAVAVGLLAARVPAEPPGLGLDLSAAATAPQTVTLRPPGPLFTVAGMRAGGPGAHGSITVLNPTARTERVRLRAVSTSDALDNALMVDVTAGERTVYRGPLGGLRRSPPAFTFGTGDGVELSLRAWLPPGARGWRGHIEDLTLSFEAKPATAR